jgi:hypothetical protein
MNAVVSALIYDGLSAVWLLEWPSGVLQRGFIDYDSDAIRLRNPDELCRLTRSPGRVT